MNRYEERKKKEMPFFSFIDFVRPPNGNSDDLSMRALQVSATCTYSDVSDAYEAGGRVGFIEHVRSRNSQVVQLRDCSQVRVKQVFPADAGDMAVLACGLPLGEFVHLEDVGIETLRRLASASLFKGGKFALEFLHDGEGTVTPFSHPDMSFEAEGKKNN